jgi:uncharacterized repeat protein (TIGR03803 family)
MKNAMCLRLSVGATAILLLTACGGGLQAPLTIQPRTASHQVETASSSYKIVYNFGSGSDGVGPGELLDVNGTFYGPTYYGGTYNEGTIFSVTTAGAERVLHDFSGYPDGGEPSASLTDVKGTLYGPTAYGGAKDGVDDGTIFSISTTGTENELYSFTGTSGAQPDGALANVKGRLYGTTLDGGGTNYSPAHGSVFSITTAGAERVLHSFGGGVDGENPVANLIDVKGGLYGTTSHGGMYFTNYNLGGTVFSVTTSGKEHVLHSFGNGSDGRVPAAGLIDVKGTLYGTTAYGGTYYGSNDLGGTVFSIAPSGTERVLHSFGSGSDGRDPVASLIAVNGTLYGTTFYGGKYNEGTIFSVTTTGVEQLLHSFGHASDGYYPMAGLIDLNGTLYGTASVGGAYTGGIVFALRLTQ